MMACATLRVGIVRERMARLKAALRSSALRGLDPRHPLACRPLSERRSLTATIIGSRGKYD
jgi:hypothetical protein